MHEKQDRARRIAALALAVLLGLLSAAVPMLDHGPGHRLPAFEPEGAGSSCVLGHDHGICTQYGANPLAVTSAQPLHTAVAVRPAEQVVPESSHPRFEPFALPGSRAPPAA